jgi:hypothetical protein
MLSTTLTLVSEHSLISSEVLATTFVQDPSLEPGENDLGLAALLSKS